MPSRSPTREPVFPPERGRETNGISHRRPHACWHAGCSGECRHGTVRVAVRVGGRRSGLCPRRAKAAGRSIWRRGSGLRIPGGRDGGGGGGGGPGIRGGRGGGGGGGGEPGPWRGGNASGWTEQEVQPEAQPRGCSSFGHRGGIGGRGVRRGLACHYPPRRRTA